MATSRRQDRFKKRVEELKLGSYQDKFDPFLNAVLGTNRKSSTLMRSLIKRYLTIIHSASEEVKTNRAISRIERKLTKQTSLRANWKPLKSHHDVMRHQEMMVLANCSSEVFYRSKEWKKFRFHVLSRRQKVCVICKSQHEIQVDHIKPRSLYPDLAFEESNMQLLCKTCNEGKGIGTPVKRQFKIKRKNKEQAP